MKYQLINFLPAEKGAIYHVAVTGQIWLQVNFDLT